MNKKRRKSIEDIINKIEELKIDIETIKDEEQEAYDNMPEGLQCSQMCENMESAISSLEYAYDSLDDAINNLNEATEY